MNATAKPLPKWRRRLPLLIPAFLLLLAVGFAFSFHFYGIVGVSMAPALQDGDMVLVQTALYTPKQGDIVVFCKPSFLNDTMVKRVIAVGGQHVKIDYEAGLVYVMFKPSPKGHIKYCSQAILEFAVSLEPVGTSQEKKGYTVEMPIGMFSRCQIKAPCGMTGVEEYVESFDDPNVFFSPKRVQAECIWFDQGFISYNFPTDFPRDCRYSQITFSFEVCSETMYYNNEWESDITVCINQREILTFTSAGDFGGRRGKYTPLYWPVTSTQFGVLKRITVDEKGVWEDQVLVSDKVRFQNLKIGEDSTIRLDIGVKEDAVHRGGVNLFGRSFGDYPQAIVMSLK